MTDVETRICSACVTEKPLTDYYRQSTGVGGYMSQCTACNNSRPPTATRLVRNRARGRAFQLLADRHPEEFAQLLEEETVKAAREHEEIQRAAAAKGAHDANVARIKPGPKRKSVPGKVIEQNSLERLDVARCPHCQTHHDADHQCPGCGGFTPKEPSTPVLMGKPTPPFVIREWAYRNGISCAPRGPIPKDVLVRYAQAHRRLLIAAEPADGDNSDDTPAYDEAIVSRALSGDRTVWTGQNHLERVEVVRRARKRGMSLRDIERITGITKPERYLQSDGGAA